MKIEEYIKMLCNLRAKYDIFSPTEGAFKSGVSASTVYYFEHGKSKNSKLLMFYVRALYKELKYNSAFIAKKTGLSSAEIKKDANSIIDGLLEIL